MKLERVIIHEVFKPHGQLGAKLSKSLSCMDHTNEDVIKLVSELNRRYRKRNEKNGVFDKNQPTIFHDCFDKYHSDCTDEKFIEFSHKSAENLKDKMDSLSQTKGGYLVYASYEEYRRYCSVFFVRDTTSIAFKRNKTVNSFDLDKVQHIDFEKLAMACRINMDLFNQENSKYLSFIHNKSDQLSQYFVRWISTSDTVSSEEETKSLLKALKKMPLPEASGETVYKRDEIIYNTHRMIQANPTRTVDVKSISKSLFDDEDYLSDYLYENFPNVPSEFKAHSTALKSFVKVHARTEDVELLFYPSAYRNGIVRIDENDDSQIIIKSENLASQVRESMQND